MSIAELIELWEGSRFVHWQPLLPGRHSRVLYLANDLSQEIENGDDYRFGNLWSDLDHFSSGGLITVGYDREPTCMMKCLNPRLDEIWEIRSKDPEPQIRIFGRFCGVDQFFATHAIYRDRLGDPHNGRFDGNHWPEEIQRCHHIWNEVFQGHPPHTGVSIGDYISESVNEVGKLP